MTKILINNTENNTKTPITIQNSFSNTPKISVIIPVYNMEKYLPECLDSIVNQTLTDIEIICIDDGSTDNSLDTLKEYAKKDARFVIISTDHIGTGRCRNIALDIAKGKYIGFIDPDDYVENTYYEKLYDAGEFNNADIVFQTSRIEFNEKTSKKCKITTPVSNDLITLKDNIIISGLHLWSKIFKNDFVKKHNLRNYHSRRSQDLLFTVPATILADKIQCIDSAAYFYRKGHTSVTQSSFSINDIKELLSLYDELEKISNLYPHFTTVIKYKRNVVFSQIYQQSSNTENKEIIKQLAKDSFFTDFDMGDDELQKVSLKNPSTDNIDKLKWGDYWLGLDLATALKKNNYSVVTDYQGRFNRNKNVDINIVIRGLSRWKNIRHKKINVLYIISHPDDIKKKELKHYDIIISASLSFYNKLKEKGYNVYYLPQFTNINRFYNEKNNDYKNQILFVGAPHHGMRNSVKYALRNKLPISIYGHSWDKYIDTSYIKDSYVDNMELYKYYSNADIVLNDTMQNMKDEGFISNRIYDVAACKGFIISDYMPEIEAIYGDAIPMYKNEQEFVELINHYLQHPEERKIKAEKAYQITKSKYTNEYFANELKKILVNYKRDTKTAIRFFFYDLLRIFKRKKK